MKKQLTNQQIIDLFQSCKSVSKYRGRQFQQAVILNRKRIESIVESLEELRQPDADIISFREQLKKIKIQFIDKENSTKDNIVYTDNKKYLEEIIQLKTKHSNSILKFEDQQTEYLKQLKEVVEVDLIQFDDPYPTGTYPISSIDQQNPKIIPTLENNSLTLGEMEGLLPMLKRNVYPEVTTIEITRHGILDYWMVFNSLMGVTESEFNKIFLENLRVFNFSSEAILSSNEIKNYNDSYIPALQELTKKHAQKNELDEFVRVYVNSNQYGFKIIDQQVYEKEIQILNEQYKDTIDKHNAFLNEVVPLSVYSIPEKVLWDDINGEQMECLIDFIK